eukprot:CAMPEP_0182455156 /NCGR_PEP_ID=MMETSP1319-20130603/1454_1 /TAXON_ID=172717 /ORGANISM="Bolidomonas pacifica, Strain RCC208" /LENGTH=113 /DNA_ID=CAMNT_0024653195 /DNA_START=15 /DNA_END=353 /DNA_ORIENTATION=-
MKAFPSTPLLPLLILLLIAPSLCFLPPSLRPPTSRPSTGVGRTSLFSADFYADLGIGRNADAAEIKSGFRKMARKYHPDVNPSEDAKAKFQQANRAYEVLSDANMKARYDQFG